MELGFRESVEPLIGSKTPRESLDALYASLLLYVFRGCKQADVREVISRHRIDFDFLSWRRGLHRNGVLMKNCKVWAFNSFVEGRALPAKFASITPKDRNALTQCLGAKVIRRHLDGLVAYGARPLTMSALDEHLCESLYSREVTAYMKSLVRSKLGFVVRSHGVTNQDFVDELRIGALFTLLKSYPRYEDVGHMKAICKSQAHNHTINLIHKYTTASRQRLIENSDGSYSNLIVPLSEFGPDQFVQSESNLTSSYLVTGLDGVSQSTWEQNFALEEMSKSSRLSDKQRMFISLMVGNPCAEFSAFLGCDNTEAVCDMQYKAYMRQVCMFLRVPLVKAEAFLLALRKEL